MIPLTEDRLFLWSLALVVGFPLLMVLLTEVVDRLQRRGHPLAGPLRQARTIVLPLLAALLVMQHILGYTETPALRLVATLFWLAVLVVAFRGLKTLLAPADAVSDWRQNVPTLLLEIPRLLLALVIVYYILAGVWNVDVAGLITALGVGSLVIALALQDALSNLFSGLLLSINRPFQIGDWINSGEVEGQVYEVNWRTSTVRTRDNDLLVIPNGTMAKNLLKNYSRPTQQHRVVEELAFHIDSPPNLVRRVLEACALSTPGVLADPAPDARTMAYEDYRVHYQIFFWIEDYGPIAHIRNRFMTRVYYQARRYGLKWPAPARALYHFTGAATGGDDAANLSAKVAALRSVPAFARLVDAEIEALAAAAELLDYGRDEKIVVAGEPERGIYLLQHGRAVLCTDDATGRERAIAELCERDFFGETGLFGRSISAVTVTALDDVGVLFLPRSAMTEVIEKHPYFAAQMNALIEARKRLIHHAQSGDQAQRAAPFPNGQGVG